MAYYFRVNSDRNSSFCSHVAYNQYFKPFMLFKRAFYTMTFHRLKYILHTGFLISVSYSCFLFAGMAVSQEPGHWCHKVPECIDESGKIKQINSSRKDLLAPTFEKKLNITEQRPSFFYNIYNTFLITPDTNLWDNEERENDDLQDKYQNIISFPYFYPQLNILILAVIFYYSNHGFIRNPKKAVLIGSSVIVFIFVFRYIHK